MSVDISIISLLDVTNNTSVQAELRDAIEDAQLIDWQTQWQPALIHVLQQLAKQGIAPTHWPQSWHWNWRDKITQVTGLLAFRGFSVVCSGVTQGLMRVDLNKTSQISQHKGKPLAYVDYLEVAPWNRPDLGQPVRYKGVGSALMVAAIELSKQEGFKGRVGLHSLPQSVNFYRDSCGMIDFGSDANYQHLPYFEMTPEQAQAFLDEEI